MFAYFHWLNDKKNVKKEHRSVPRPPKFFVVPEYMFYWAYKDGIYDTANDRFFKPKTNTLARNIIPLRFKGERHEQHLSPATPNIDKLVENLDEETRLWLYGLIGRMMCPRRDNWEVVPFFHHLNSFHEPFVKFVLSFWQLSSKPLCMSSNTNIHFFKIYHIQSFSRWFNSLTKFNALATNQRNSHAIWEGQPPHFVESKEWFNRSFIFELNTDASIAINHKLLRLEMPHFQKKCVSAYYELVKMYPLALIVPANQNLLKRKIVTEFHFIRSNLRVSPCALM